MEQSATEQPPERFIRFSRKKLLIYMAPLPFLLAISLVVAPENWNLSLSLVLGFAALGLFLVLGWFVAPYRYYLHLSAEGLTFRHFGGHRFYRWREILEFRVEGANIDTIRDGRYSNLIVFDFTDDAPHRTMIRHLASKVLGYDESIWSTFELPANEIVVILNDWRERYTFRDSSRTSR